ncbi:hypothetical protein AB0M22_00805 [Nocardia sp. NPDC051756]|uniref:hypothetical protein n=1 Tax=Nocardia sp. NPDC051756 TaxID=3154751 RepID=UPI0034491289
MGNKRAEKSLRREQRQLRDQTRQKRKQKKAEKRPEVGDIVQVNTGPVHLVLKVLDVQRFPTRLESKYTVSLVEETIHPVTVKHHHPLLECAQNRSGFTRYWEKLIYLFDLPEPADFPTLRGFMRPADLPVLQRFIDTCRQLAGYSVMNTSGGKLNVSLTLDGPKVTATLPSHERFSGMSTTFRQVHNTGDEASFSKAMSALQRALDSSGLDTDQKARVKSQLNQWGAARKVIMKKTMATAICERVDKEWRETPRKKALPVLSFQGVEPDDLILKYNYGDTIHWGKHRDELADLTSQKDHDLFYKYCVLNSMISLAHLYLGFSALVDSALGSAKVTSYREVL